MPFGSRCAPLCDAIGPRGALFRERGGFSFYFRQHAVAGVLGAEVMLFTSFGQITAGLTVLRRLRNE
jgi:hypothetical protein